MNWSIRDLTDRFSLTERQIHFRLEQLDSLLVGHVKRGNKNAKLLDDYAFSLLERLIMLESNGTSTKDAVEQLKAELDNDVAINKNGNVELSETACKTLLEQLQNENNFLKREIDRLHERIAELTALLQNRLPPTREEIKQKRWWQFWR